MPRQASFRLSFAPETITHLDAINSRYHRLIAKTIAEQLTLEPESQARNRKPLEQPAPYEATWELRFGRGNRFRVFYEVDEAGQTVWVLAIGVKVGNRLFIGGEEFEL
jgi:mRNA-degrading endonuclease RelE of RelBE toxin-antitoxin system